MTDAVQIPTDTVALPGGGAIPLVGFGTWQLKGDECYAACVAAFEAGYRHLDTATMYGNEAEVGRALADSGVPRDEVFLTTKYNPRSGRPELDVLGRSLDALGVEHVDLWLVHAPADDRRNAAIWESFGQAQAAGTARDVGVSNFSVEQIDHVSASGVVPSVNQIEWRPPLYNDLVVEGHRSRNVVLEGYSALKGGVLTDGVVTGIATEVGTDARTGRRPLARPARRRGHPPVVEGRADPRERRRRRVRALRGADGLPGPHGPSPLTTMDPVAAAFAALPREGFLPEGERRRAAYDGPLAIGHGQTNSQPRTVEAMLRLLEVAPGQRVLDVGSGSGWTTALLAHLVGPTGSVVGVELEPTLVEFGSANLAATDQPWASIRAAAPGVLGVPDHAPYDRILVSAEPSSLPQALVDQLGEGGRLVIPVRGTMTLVTRIR